MINSTFIKKLIRVSALAVLISAILMTDLNAQTTTTKNRWKNAGITGGMPSIPSNVASHSATIKVTTKTAGAINEAIASAAKNNSKKYVYLPNGTYAVNTTINMSAGVYLVGQSRTGVVLELKNKSKDGIVFDGDSNSGLYNLTMQGKFYGDKVPPENWGCSTCTYDEDNKSKSIRVVSSKNVLIRNVDVINSGNHTIWLGPTATHVTVFNTKIKGCYNTGRGTQGYFMIMGKDNLITQCEVENIRHISIQGSSAEYNVIYNNTKLKQEISFHADDNGNNLIEANTITLPSGMPDGYYAIMGTWSTSHSKSRKNNFIYRNNCIMNNQTVKRLYAGQYGTNAKVFVGPIDGKKEAIAAGRTYDHTKNFKSNGTSPSKLYSGSPNSRLVIEEDLQEDLASTEGFKVFPNPSNGLINIQLPGDTDSIQIEIYDQTGTKVFVKEYQSIEDGQLLLDLTGQLIIGTYIVKASDGIQSYSSRIIISQ